MKLSEQVGAEGVSGANGVDHVDLAARHVIALVASEDAGAVGSASDEHQGVLSPFFGDVVYVSLALIEPLDIFVAGFDDVAEGVDAFDTNALVLRVEAQGGANVDVVRDGDAGGVFGPLLDDQVAWLHGHGEASELNAVDAHVGELCVGG